METILAAAVTGAFSLVGIIITVKHSNQKMMQAQEKALQEMKAEFSKAQAVTDVKLDELTREVRSHNNFAQRMPVVEEQIKVANHRIDDLESFHKHA